MEFRDVLALRSPNIWGRFPAIETRLHLAPGDPAPTNGYVDFRSRLVTAIEPLVESMADDRQAARLLSELRSADCLPAVLIRLALEFERLAGVEASFTLAAPAGENGNYRVVLEHGDERLARASLDLARSFCQATIEGLSLDLINEVQTLRDLSDHVCLGPSSLAIISAAVERGVPVRRLNDESLVQLGHGARQRRIWTAATDRTSSIAEAIARDKELTKTLLRAAGVPVPEGRRVESAEDAWAAACEIGLPVVVKPIDANHGRGVFINLNTSEEVKAAYVPALAEGSDVIVERYAHGAEHRLLIVGDRMAAAARGEPDCVIGDGVSTIVELVQRMNTDPRRNSGPASTLSLIELGPVTDLLLSQQGYTLESRPADGVSVLIQHNGDLTTDETADVHPDVEAHCVAAAQAVGLDVAGVDLIARDISRPLSEQGGVIVEVNAGPSLLMHVRPQIGSPQPVGEAILSTLFPGAAQGRVPLVAVIGGCGAEIAQLVAKLMRHNGWQIGRGTSEGTFCNERRIMEGDRRDAVAVDSVLLNPMIEAAVFELSAANIRREGLGFDHCDVLVVTDLAAEDVDAARVVADSTFSTGSVILNADDPQAALLASANRATVFFTTSDDPQTINRCREMHKLVYIRAGSVMLADGELEVALSTLLHTSHALQHHKPLMIVASVAAVWALGLPIDVIRAGIADF